MLTIGHRGAKGHIAENTLPSFRKAIALGAGGIELDVHTCATGEVVVIHDFTIDRTTNGSGNVSELTLQELKSLIIDKVYEIPTLIEVVDALGNNVFINIELKGAGTAQPVAAILEAYINNKGYKTNNLIVSSFNYQELQYFKSYTSTVPIGILTENNLQEAMKWAAKLSAKAIHADFNLLNDYNVKQMQQAGYKVMAWTVNKPEDVARIKSYGVNGIICDYPERL